MICGRQCWDVKNNGKELTFLPPKCSTEEILAVGSPGPPPPTKPPSPVPLDPPPLPPMPLNPAHLLAGPRVRPNLRSPPLFSPQPPPPDAQLAVMLSPSRFGGANREGGLGIWKGKREKGKDRCEPGKMGWCSAAGTIARLWGPSRG